MSYDLQESLILYLKGPKFRRYIPDWIVTTILLAYFFVVAEYARPFSRQFSLSDLTLSHPHATVERVSGPQCIALASILPSLVIVIATFLKHRNSRNSKNGEEQIFHNVQVAVLGLAVAISSTGIVTDIFKNWIARPRPDFLARCGAPPETPVDRQVDISVCTAPYGADVLLDGLRSTPSGHSSISFVAFSYLTLWLAGQFQLLRKPPQLLYKYVLTALPLLVALYISLSRAQDYRHHFYDIILGSCLGCCFAWMVFHHYWEDLRGEDCTQPRSRETDDGIAILPV
ncbi:uncharacterized protein LODBEIA_P05290 [Lodderomyces beijingensis]|uniref:Phosphatidic acid phosphatase type 2/haloperoxidase domain-containing protein n=1 Tax=Lodderomyces beijingensis TaxID=1775926 RepID=A0ABP0ZGL0_9ASCO